MYIVHIGIHHYPFHDNRYAAMRSFTEAKCAGTQSDAAVLWADDDNLDDKLHILNYNFSQGTWQEIGFDHPELGLKTSAMRMPYNVHFTAADPDTGKPYTFKEVYCGNDYAEVRAIAHSMHNAEITDIQPVKLERFRIIENDIQLELESIIYTTDDEIDATEVLNKLKRAWCSGVRYTFRLADSEG